jgi:hypothetical protein
MSLSRATALLGAIVPELDDMPELPLQRSDVGVASCAAPTHSAAPRLRDLDAPRAEHEALMARFDGRETRKAS